MYRGRDLIAAPCALNAPGSRTALGVSLCVLMGALSIAQAATPEFADTDVTSQVSELSLEELMEVRISPFDVSTSRDVGYQAFSSVTGSRLDTPIRELPFPIQAFTQPFIEDVKPVTVYDIARYSPSVTYHSNDFNEGNANLAIRGFAVGSTPGSVQILRDGFHGPSIFEFTNISRLEIVKGPASFLYGQVAPGGIVNVITKTPQPQFASSAMFRYGSYGAYRFEGDVTGPIARSLMVRFVSSVDQDIHYWRPYDAHSVDFAPAILWRPSRAVTLTVKQETYRKRESPQVMQVPGYGPQQGIVPTASDPNRNGVPASGLPDTWNSMSNSDYRSSDTSSLTATLDVKAGPHWDVRAGYAQSKYSVDMLFSGNFGVSSELPFIQGRRIRKQLYTTWDDTFDLNATGHYDLGFAQLRLLLGAQYVVRRFDASAGQVPNDPAFGPVASPLPNWDLRDPTTWDRDATVAAPEFTDFRRSRTTRSRDRAAFAGTTLGLFDSELLLLAGVRGTRTESQVLDRLTRAAAPQLHAHRFTPQYGLLYDGLPNVALFATYAESFVPVPEPLQVNNVLTGPAQPTRGSGVDIGAKVDLLQGRITGTATLFDVRNSNIVNDIAHLDPTTGAQVFTRVQSGEQRTSGVEFDAVLTPFDHWQSLLSYSYNNARIVEFSGHDTQVLAGDRSAPGYKEAFRYHGAPLQMSAPHLFNLWSRYDFLTGYLAGMYLAAGVHLVLDQALLPDTPAEYRQSYALFNTLLGYTWNLAGRLRLISELYGKNLTDQRYRPSQSTRSRPAEAGLAVTLKY